MDLEYACVCIYKIYLYSIEESTMEIMFTVYADAWRVFVCVSIYRVAVRVSVCVDVVVSKCNYVWCALEVL